MGKPGNKLNLFYNKKKVYKYCYDTSTWDIY